MAVYAFFETFSLVSVIRQFVRNYFKNLNNLSNHFLKGFMLACKGISLKFRLKD